MEQRQEATRQELRETLDALTKADVVNLQSQLEGIARLERVEQTGIRLEGAVGELRKILVGDGQVGALEQIRGLITWRETHVLQHETERAGWARIQGGALDTAVKIGVGLVLALIGVGLMQVIERGHL